MQTTTSTWTEIASVLPQIDLLTAIEEAFIAYSAGDAVIPPVGEMHLEDPPGEVHLKYGHLRGGSHYVVKIASGFYGNPAQGLSSCQGLMLLFDQRTGVPTHVLLDEGRLTDARTAAAGAVAARCLAPQVQTVGIVGTGIQARLQLRHLEAVTPCREVVVWGRREQAASTYAADMDGWTVSTTQDLDELVARANLIVTTTPATEPLLHRVRAGTHITAVGSDTPTKQELAASLVARADVVVADSVAQCRLRGEISQALRAGLLDPTRVVELGDVLAGRAQGRTSEEQVTVADLTGVAVADLAIATAVAGALAKVR
jgi:ornithine cyclodeaminase